MARRTPASPRTRRCASLYWARRTRGLVAPPSVGPLRIPPALDAEGPSEPRSDGTALTQYYQACLTRWSHERYQLDKRFVQLTLLTDQGDDAVGPRFQPSSEKFNDLSEVLNHLSESAIVILGPPGSGKSTLLRHFELENARDAQIAPQDADPNKSHLTLFVPLNDYQPDHRTRALPLPMDWLAAKWAERAPGLPALETVLRQQRLTLLLDALNEMPVAGDEPLQLWKDFLRDLQWQFPNNRVVFSCRLLDYGAKLSSNEYPVRQVRVEPLSDAQVEAFVTRYRPDDGAALWETLKGTRQLELLRSPYYLRLFVAQATEGQISTGRAALFSGFVRQALQREINQPEGLFRPGDLLHQRDIDRLTTAAIWPPFALPEQGRLIPKLSSLAFQMQSRHSSNEATQIRITYDDALDLINHPTASAIIDAGVAMGVLDEDRGADEVLFVHQLLQEYFAARQLARQPQVEQNKQEWRADRVAESLQTTLAGLADSDPLPPLPSTGWEETTVLATAMATAPDRFIADLMVQNLPLAGRCAAQPEAQVTEELKQQIRWDLVKRTQDPTADLRARIAAGLALGDLGDPRFERRQGPHGSFLLPPLIDIVGGTYHIGSDDGLYEDEAPIHEATLSTFALGQFSVTNAEWALFMQSGGYDEERWWETDAAKAWRRGEDTAAGPKQQWRDNRKFIQENSDAIRQAYEQGRITSNQAESWEQIARMSNTEFEDLLAQWYPDGRQTQPANWQDDTFNNPAQPVVGICWYEARAYCAWLSAQTGETYRLPTEIEWEAAARGTQRRNFAFSNAFDAAYCNTFETHIRHTTPIDVFPGGTTPEGLVDMTGNTWEWTSTLYEPYPYDAADGRENVNSSARRVVRGGSWSGLQSLARAGYRNRYAPALRFNDVGFRLSRSSPVL